MFLKNRLEAIHHYFPVLVEISKLNKKEDGSEYDLNVLFDMLLANAKQHNAGETIVYPFEGADTFNWEDFNQVVKDL